MRPAKAMRMKCLECCNWSYTEVKMCEIHDCSLWPYRFGRRPSQEDMEIVRNTVDQFESQKRSAGIIGRGTGNAQNLKSFRNFDRNDSFDGRETDILPPDDESGF